MKEKMLISFFVIASFFFLVSCGEETESNGFYASANGTELNREEMRKAKFKPAPTVFKMTPLRPLNTQTWGPISTGQTQCFDHEKEIECPEPGSRFFFQDGNKFGTRSLREENNGQIIKDDITRRLWSKHFKENVTWYEAKYYCDSLTMEHKKWRLPTTAELRSIINYGKVNPAVDEIFYRGIDPESLSTWFWASDHSHFKSETKEDPNDEDKFASAWMINFLDGFVEYTSRYNVYNVRCVTEAE
jgi:hypothetical protein